MASKIDETIAKLAITISHWNPAQTKTAGAEAASQLSTTDLGKLPDRWYPKLSAKVAGATNLRESWPRLWFDAITEILYHKGSDGLPYLIVLFERDDATYHGMVGLRLLRLAVAGVEQESILATMKARLPNLHRTQASEVVRYAANWSVYEPEPLNLLRTMTMVKLKDADEYTIGSVIEEETAELALKKAKENPHKGEDDLAETLVSIAIQILQPEDFRASAAQAAKRLGPESVDELTGRIFKPDLPALQSRAPSTVSRPEFAWMNAILEILGHLHSEAIPVAISFLDHEDQYFQERGLRLALLLAARNEADRASILLDLQRRLPTYHHREIRSVVGGLSLDAETAPQLPDVLSALGEIVVKDYGNGQISIREIAKQVFVPKPTNKKSKAKSTVNPKEVETFAKALGTAIVAKNFKLVHEMLGSSLKKEFSSKKLTSLVSKNCLHSGPPDEFEFSTNHTTLDELRKDEAEGRTVITHLTDENFRAWCCLTFVPEESGNDVGCFDWWMAVVEEDGALKVGGFEILDTD